MTKLMSLSIAGWMIAPGSGTGLLVEPSEDIALASFPIEQVTRLWFSVQLLKDGCAFVFYTRAPIKVVITYK